MKTKTLKKANALANQIDVTSNSLVEINRTLHYLATGDGFTTCKFAGHALKLPTKYVREFLHRQHTQLSNDLKEMENEFEAL